MTNEARALLDRYLTGLRRALLRAPSVDACEIERDVFDHVECAVADADEPVTAQRIQSVIDRLGRPEQWVASSGVSTIDPSGRWLPRTRDDSDRLARTVEQALLAYFSFGLCLLAGGLFATHRDVVALVCLAGAAFAARAAASGERENHQQPVHAWLVSPALLLTYVSLAALVLLGPTIASFWIADEIVRLELLKPRFPTLVTQIAARLAVLADAANDPSKAVKLLAYSGPWVFGPIGLWWLALGSLGGVAPRQLERLFHPLLSGAGRVVAILIGGAGLAALGVGAALTIAKHV